MPNLYGKEFVFLFDDSGSMRNTDSGATMSRWNELKQFSSNAIALASAFDPDGVDVYFLNRPKVSNVKSIAQLEQVFLKEPTDYCLTPLTNKLELILHEHRQKFAKGNLILIIATDGEPRSQDGTDSVHAFTEALKKRHHTVGVSSASGIPVSIRACTNDINSISYLNKLDNDKKMYLDVCDDYQSELIEIQKVLGSDFAFTFGDFTLKVLLGSVDAWMDNTDEPQNFTTQEVNYQKFGEVPSQYVDTKRKKGLFGMFKK